MTDYIINPMWIYWAHVLDGLKIACIIIAVFAAISTVIGVIIIAVNKQYGEDDEDYETGKTVFRYSLPIFVFSFLAGTLIPSEKTLVEMLVAKLATKQNIELTVDGLKQLVDYIAETIRSLK